eukprot:8770436-Pyramimonas_sp.AAC.1
MRLILDKVGLDNVRLNMIKEICDTCQECRAWERPGNFTLPSVSLPGNWLDEGEQAKRCLIENVTLYSTPTTTAGLPIMDPSKSCVQMEKAPSTMTLPRP